MARTRNEALHRERREQILTAAAELFAYKGIHQTSMQEICEASGVSAGALYRYYDSKNAIILALAEVEREQNLLLTQTTRDSRCAIDGLSSFLPALLETMLEERYGRLTLEIGAEVSRNAEARIAFHRNDGELRQALVAAILRDQEQRIVDPDLDPEAAAFVIMAMLDGIAGRAAFVGGMPADRLLGPIRLALSGILSPGGGGEEQRAMTGADDERG